MGTLQTDVVAAQNGGAHGAPAREWPRSQAPPRTTEPGFWAGPSNLEASVFSRRVPSSLAPNSLTLAREHLVSEGADLIDLTVSNPTVVGVDYPPHLLAPLADPRGLVYRPEPRGLLEARRAVAADYARRATAVDPERIVLTASTSEAYSLLFKVLCDAGDEVLVPQPGYPLFEHLTSLDLVRPVPYALEYHAVWQVDVSSVERALTSRTRAVLVVSPNNPTGSFVRQSELVALADLCAEHDLALIVDEVFADYRFDEGSANLWEGAFDALRCMAFSLGGLSKSVGLPQLKLGWIAVGGPPARAAEALDRLVFAADAYLSVSTPVQHAAAALLASADSVRVQILERIRRNYRALCSLASTHPAIDVLSADGGWSAVVRVPALLSEEALTLALMTMARVIVHPGYFFDFPREAYLVVSLLVPEALFLNGMTRVLELLQRVARGEVRG